ncbi:MAG TPA: phage baseplate assembly protein V [Allosphingosinicella sp.]|nr:phage baseplate assembly protein V [Allosphingosinicella sp.]
MTEGCPSFYGKYRGEVATNFDPQGLGRVQVSVPDVLGDGKMAWAMPCLPGAGPSVGFFAIPPIGAAVWVEFERGDPDYPIWTGGFWKIGDTPAPMGPQQPFTKCWAGDNFKIEIVDMPGIGTVTLSLKTPAGEAKLLADATALTLSWGKSTVKLAIDGVSINGTNLKVLP